MIAIMQLTQLARGGNMIMDIFVNAGSSNG